MSALRLLLSFLVVLDLLDLPLDLDLVVVADASFPPPPTTAASPPPSTYTAFPDVDITTCAYPCVRAFECGLGFSTPCDPAAVAKACDSIPECVSFNSNSWLKGCANATCGAAFEPSTGTTVWIKDGGYLPPAPVPLVDDPWYPPEQPQEEEDYEAALPSLIDAGPGWAVLAIPGGGSQVNVSVGAAAGAFTLLAAGSDGWGSLGSGSYAVVERLFARWGALSLLNAAQAVLAPIGSRPRKHVIPASTLAGLRCRGRRGLCGSGDGAREGYGNVKWTGGEAARLLRTVGAALNTTQQSYASLVESQPSYYIMADYLPTDYLGGRAQALSGPELETTYAAAASFLPPQRDYTSIGAIAPKQKFSVSPDGRIKSAYGDIYTPTLLANETGPGLLVWDPALAPALTPGTWPLGNWTATKSGLVGGFLRVVVTGAVDTARGVGFEQIAFAPASEPAASVYIRVRATATNEPMPQDAFYNVSLSMPLEPAPLDPAVFYEALVAEQALWEGDIFGWPDAGVGQGETLGDDATSTNTRESIVADAAILTLPGQEGRRQMDAVWGSVVTALSLYVGLLPNYGDGGAYMSPNSSLTSNIAPVDLTLLELNLLDLAADRVGYVMDSFIREDGSMPECDSVDSGGFGDALADYGETLDLFVRVARAQLAWRNASVSNTWVSSRLPHFAALANFTLQMRRNATAKGPPPGTMGAGLVWGSPEHDTAHEPGLYFHNNAWLLRGLRVAGKFLRDEGGATYADLAGALLAEAPAFSADFAASLVAAVLRNESGKVLWVPALADTNSTPYGTMTESILASYTNFRYYPELLSADVIEDDDIALGLMEFRESHAGTFLGMTRFEGHLDDMPTAGYAFADLRYGRLSSFWLLTYGHLAGYMGRGTFTATEQVPWMADSLGLWRDYLWEYLEGGIDQCVPSLLFIAQATRWSLVFERGFDATGNTTVWIGLGSPRRWWSGVPAGHGVELASPGGFGAEDMLTSYGLVSFWAQAEANGTLSSVHVVLDTPPYRPVPNDTVVFAVTVRSALQCMVVANATVVADAGNPAGTTVMVVGSSQESVWVAVAGLSGGEGPAPLAASIGFVVEATYAAGAGESQSRNAVSPTTRAAVCTSGADCSLNGVCNPSGVCECDAGWGGAACQYLQLGTSSVAYGVPAAAGAHPLLLHTSSGQVSSWGGSVLEVDGLFHMWAAEIVGGCGMRDWNTNSRCVHATSASVAGPYDFQDEAVPTVCHNPVVVYAPNGGSGSGAGLYFLFHIGNGTQTPVPCTTGTGSPVTQNRGYGLQVSSTPSGPWQPAEHQPPPCDNPGPVLLRNGTWLLACKDPTTVVYSAPAAEGPWTAVGALPPNTASTRNEDAFLWEDVRGGVHVLRHAYMYTPAPPPPATCAGDLVSSHAWSEDGGRTWTQSAFAPYENTFQQPAGEGASGGVVATRERPKLFFDASGHPVALFNGVSALETCTSTCVDCKWNGTSWTYTMMTAVGK